MYPKASIIWKLILSVFFFTSLQTHVYAMETRVALVIGNSKYPDMPLSNPANDASDVADSLRELGFDVELALNLSYSDMNEMISEFGKKLNKADVGLFFYAGHGVQSDGVNYLIPVNTDLSHEKSNVDKVISTSSILQKMEFAKNGVNIIVLDACRNNPLSQNFIESSTYGLAKIKAPSASFIAYSTAPGNVAADGLGRNSPYTQNLLKQINIPNQTIEQTFKKVRVSVVEGTNGQQVPWENSSLLGDFYFVEPIVSDELTKGGRYASIDQFELDFWKTLQKEPSRELYESYLKKFPKGHFNIVAQEKLKQMGNGMITIRSNVFGDSIKINGEYRATSKSTLSLAPDEYTVEVSKLGFNTVTKNVTLAAEQHLDLQFTLQAKANNDNTSMRSVSLNSEPIREVRLPEPELVEKNISEKVTPLRVSSKSTSNSIKLPKTNILVEYSKEKNIPPLINEKIEPIIDMQFVNIKAGCFIMGSSPLEDGRLNDEKSHNVCLSKDYWIAKYEVTQAQWEKVMGSNPSFFKGCGGDCPVERVSWNEVQGFIFKLNLQTGQKYRLPTEAEWEYAARAGTKSSTYIGNSELLGQNNASKLNDIAWYSGNSAVDYRGGQYCEDWDEKEFDAVRCGVHPVGQKQANQWHIYDMIGNVWEWTNDVYGYLSTKDVVDPIGAEKGNKSVVKGGSWEGSLSQNRSAARYGFAKNKKMDKVGFRLVITDE
ncbi:MAG: SUMF1/EgtB/PvdO family nonheme iron enzyme [Gammaproteobacteria bacterium]|nr:SUMF1/EgtB/PvdO family nonheme iron enzyme [Gammaproteobacteria bacterium]